MKIKKERYNRVHRLSDTRYSTKGTKGNGDMQAAKIEMRHLPAISIYGYGGGVELEYFLA